MLDFLLLFISCTLTHTQRRRQCTTTLNDIKSQWNSLFFLVSLCSAAVVVVATVLPHCMAVNCPRCVINVFAKHLNENLRARTGQAEWEGRKCGEKIGHNVDNNQFMRERERTKNGSRQWGADSEFKNSQISASLRIKRYRTYLLIVFLRYFVPHRSRFAQNIDTFHGLLLSLMLF